MASLAELLDYDQRKKQALHALTDYASSQYKLGSAFSEGLSDQAKGLWQTVRHPIDTAVDTATNIYQAGKAAIQDPKAAYQAAKEGLTEAVSSPQNIARFAGQNFNPLELANALNKVGTMRQLTVYHGTPHRFEPTPDNPLGEFTASKIGTGEGAAAYGHGIYTAQNPKIALSYKRNLSSKDEIPNVYYKGQHYLNRIPELVGDKGQAVHLVAEILKDDLPFNEAKARAKARIQYEYNNDLESLRGAGYSDEEVLQNALYTPEQVKNILNEIDSLDSSTVQRVGEPKEAGYLYTADLPDEKIDQMLDWDKPLSEQSAHVQKVIEDLRNDPNVFVPPFKNVVDEPVGQSLYHFLGVNKQAPAEFGGKKFLDQSPATVSELLRQRGIPGIKYLDEGSRSKSYQIQLSVKGKPYETDPIMFATKEQADKAAKDYAAKGFTADVKNVGTRNFVVFPGEEKNLKILSRE